MRIILLIWLCLVGLNCLAASIAVTIESPYNAVTNWIKLGSHIHTLISPTPDGAGNHPLSDVCLHFGNTNNFGAYIITEHEQLSTNSIPPYANGLFIQGEEIACLTNTPTGNHIIGMFLTSNIAGGWPDRTKVMQDAINEIVAQGGIAALAHPGSPTLGIATNLSAALTNFQYCAVFNQVILELEGSVAANSANYWDWLLSIGRRCWGYAELDSHWTLYTNAYQQIFVDATNEAAVKTAMINGNTVFGCNPLMRVSVTNKTIYADAYGVPSTFEWIVNGPSARKTTLAVTNDSFQCIGSEGYVRVQAFNSVTNKSYSQPMWVSRESLNHNRTRRTPRRR